MIDPKSRSKEWILESCGKNKVNDPTLMEKTIRAFSLLEALAKSGCPFLFKGGSALMLQLACTQRLSVDIDIVYVFRTISVQCSGDTRSLLSGKDRLLATKLILFS